MTGNYGGQGGRGNVTLFNVIATPLLIIILTSVLLTVQLVGLIGALVKGGEIVYEEVALTNYVDGVYNGQFKKHNGKVVEGKNAQQSGIAILFFYNEDKGIIEHTVKMGTNVSSKVQAAFSGETSAMNKYLTEKVNKEGRKDSLAKVLTGLMKELGEEIDGYDLTSPFVQKTELDKVPASAAIIMPVEKKNEKAQPLTTEDGTALMSVADEATLSKAMVEFTNKTGIPVVMSIDTSVRAFGRTIPTSDIFMVVLLMVVLALCIVNLVKKIRDFNRIKNDFAGQDPAQGGIKVNARSPYYDEDDDDEVVVDDFETVDESDDESEEAEENSEDEAEETEEDGEDGGDGEDEAEETEEEKSEDNNGEAQELKKRSLNTQIDDEDEEDDENEEDEKLSFEDEEEDEDNGIIDSGDESYDDDETYTDNDGE